MLNVDPITPLTRAELANARIRALLAGARGGALDAGERERYAALVDEYLLARRLERAAVEIAVAA